jgi:hypothetical protein
VKDIISIEIGEPLKLINLGIEKYANGYGGYVDTNELANHFIFPYTCLY